MRASPPALRATAAKSLFETTYQLQSKSTEIPKEQLLQVQELSWRGMVRTSENFYSKVRQKTAAKWEVKIPKGKLFYGVPTFPQLSTVLFLSLHTTVPSLGLSCSNYLWVILPSGELMEVGEKPQHPPLFLMLKDYF